MSATKCTGIASRKFTLTVRDIRLDLHTNFNISPSNAYPFYFNEKCTRRLKCWWNIYSACVDLTCARTVEAFGESPPFGSFAFFRCYSVGIQFLSCIMCCGMSEQMFEIHDVLLTLACSEEGNTALETIPFLWRKET